MKNCKKIEKQLTAYIHEELNEKARSVVEEHLAGCESCRAEAECLSGTLDLLNLALEEAPAPTELKPWWNLSSKIRTPRKSLSDMWYSPRFKAVLASGAVFGLLFLVSMNIVVFKVFMRNDVSYEEVEVTLDGNVPALERPRMSLKVPKPPSSGAPVSTARIVSRTQKTDVPDFKFSSVDYGIAYQGAGGVVASGQGATGPYTSNETYDHMVENSFKAAMENPLSTFSIDVDTAAYSNIRRYLTNNDLPPVDAVRIEEMVNYFSYDYPEPAGTDPFLVSMELDDCPWNENHQLALVGLQGVKVDTQDLPPNNLVFLLDVSGSMNSSDKLPLLKSAMRLLTTQLRPQDRISIVVYAGAAGLVLEPTNDHAEVLAALDNIRAGGSTAGGAGIELAYKMAKDSFIEDGNNRVILATDGDFNVGIQSDGDLVRMIKKKRDSGIYLSVLGFGSGNIQDSKMEKLANRGNGNYAYIDDILEAKKVLVNEMGGTLMTIAKDVKVQVEFNPSIVKAYRLIGYENRMLAKEDFADDKKDAGELGAGHAVTALYELVMASSSEQVALAGDLKYQRTKLVDSDELMTVKLRYKGPNGDTSRLITETVALADFDADAINRNIGFASAVAEFGLLLRDSEFKGVANYEDVLVRAKKYRGSDQEGYRSEFIRMVQKAQLLKREDEY